ncbi:MAG TPA: methyltransferase [Candidatus Eremiobacteraceae bacterium]|nr:methyltransferase [Candidatus Eremiobacteraceae bacterium]
MHVNSGGFRTLVFKNRGALLVPVALVLLVLGRPTMQSALIGVIVAAIGEAIRIWAVGYSGVTTRAAIVTAPTLITGGPYGAVRNPLYLANAIIALGFLIAFAGGVSPLEGAIMTAVVALLVCGVYAIIIPLEESYLAGVFGERYRRYVKAVPSIMPVGSRLAPEDRYGKWRAEVIARAEIITLAFFVVMIVVVALKLGPWRDYGVFF